YRSRMLNALGVPDFPATRNTMSQSVLHNAAIELIPAVSRTTVREVLTLLVADPAFDDVTAVAVAAPCCPPKPQAAAGAVDPWAELKKQLRARMTEQGLDYAALGATIGMTEAGLADVLQRNRPPSAA